MTNPFHLFICGSGDSAAAVLWNTLWEPQARPAGNDRFPLPLGSIRSVHSAASEPQLSGSVISVGCYVCGNVSISSQRGPDIFECEFKRRRAQIYLTPFKIVNGASPAIQWFQIIKLIKKKISNLLLQKASVSHSDSGGERKNSLEVSKALVMF